MKSEERLNTDASADTSTSTHANSVQLDMRIKGQDQHYEIHIGNNALDQLSSLLKGRRCAIVSDDTVWALHGKTLCQALLLHPGAYEQIESWGQVHNETLCLSPNSSECQSPTSTWGQSPASSRGLTPTSIRCQSINSDLGQTLDSALNKTQLLSISVLPNGEGSKNMEQLSRLYRDFVKAGLTRRDFVIAFGGGVIGDLAGYAAATWLRGVSFIQIPTSLLAMVDSSIGGKVAIDLPEGKNLVGAFHQPRAVLIHPQFLDTLPVRQLRDGIAEMVKAAMIRDEDLLPMILDQFRGLPRNQSNDAPTKHNQSQQGQQISALPDINTLLQRALSIKKNVVEADEKETGDRKLLNFGHTLGHAAESRGGYSALTHGEGVALGMQWITRLSEEKGLSERGTTDCLESALAELGFESAPPLDFPALKDWVLRDKKMTESGLEVILIRKPGEGYVYPIASDDVDAFFKVAKSDLLEQRE